jgi:hypothetical protein
MKMAVFWLVAPCGLEELYRQMLAASTIRAKMMEAASTSETLVNSPP